MNEPATTTPTAERLHVRGVIHRDADAVRSLLDELGYEATVEDVHTRLRALESERSTKALVAEDAGRVVGLAVVHWFELLERPGAYARLLALVVTRSYRGIGVGRRLVVACETIARRSGCLAIEVTTAAVRDDAHAFYDQLGYITGTSRYYRKSFSETG